MARNPCSVIVIVLKLGKPRFDRLYLNLRRHVTLLDSRPELNSPAEPTVQRVRDNRHVGAAETVTVEAAAWRACGRQGAGLGKNVSH